MQNTSFCRPVLFKLWGTTSHLPFPVGSKARSAVPGETPNCTVDTPETMTLEPCWGQVLLLQGQAHVVWVTKKFGLGGNGGTESALWACFAAPAPRCLRLTGRHRNHGGRAPDQIGQVARRGQEWAGSSLTLALSAGAGLCRTRPPGELVVCATPAKCAHRPRRRKKSAGKHSPCLALQALLPRLALPGRKQKCPSQLVRGGHSFLGSSLCWRFPAYSAAPRRGKSRAPQARACLALSRIKLRPMTLRWIWLVPS